MDSAIVGVIIGSGLSLLGTVINQYFQSRKDQKQWENQQSAEKMAWVRNEQKREKEYLREIYQHSLRSLSVFIAFGDQAKEENAKQKKLELIDEIHKWVTMLLLRHANSNLDNALTSFTTWPEEDEAKRLRNEIVKLSNREDGFFINEIRIKNEDVGVKSDPDLRRIQLSVENDYRKQQIIEGIEIPQSHTFEFRLSEMSKSQREKLAEIFFQSLKTIPDKLNLYVPIHQKGAKQISMQGKQWQAKLNPNTTEPKDMLTAWEVDYQKYYLEAKQSLEVQMKNSVA